MRCYTTRAAWLGFEENSKGKPEPGFLADMALLSADPFRCPPEELREIEVVETVVGGLSRWSSAAK